MTFSVPAEDRDDYLRNKNIAREPLSRGSHREDGSITCVDEVSGSVYLNLRIHRVTKLKFRTSVLSRDFSGILSFSHDKKKQFVKMGSILSLCHFLITVILKLKPIPWTFLSTFCV